jgi:hypothetical protein
MKDMLQSITFTQNYIHQLRRENVVRNTAGQSAVMVTKKKKVTEPVMADVTGENLKDWAKTQEVLKKFKNSQQPFRGRGNYRGRGKFPQFRPRSSYRGQSFFRGRNFRGRGQPQSNEQKN